MIAALRHSDLSSPYALQLTAFLLPPPISTIPSLYTGRISPVGLRSSPLNKPSPTWRRGSAHVTKYGGHSLGTKLVRLDILNDIAENVTNCGAEQG